MDVDRVPRRCGELAARASRSLRDAPPERRAVLLEMAAFADFLVEQIPLMQAGVEGSGGRRCVAAGELPAQRSEKDDRR